MYLPSIYANYLAMLNESSRRLGIPKYCASEEAHPLSRLRESGFGLGEDLGKRLGSPAKRMSDRIPLGDELGQALGQFGQVREGGLVEALALQNGEPLLHRVHPGAMHGGEVRDEPRMRRQPGL